MLDRSSAPKTVANKTDPQTVELIAALRRLRFSGPQISELTGRPLSTVCAVLKRLRMNRLGRLGLEPAQRYEHELPGALIWFEQGGGTRLLSCIVTKSPGQSTYLPREGVRLSGCGAAPRPSGSVAAPVLV